MQRFGVVMVSRRGSIIIRRDNEDPHRSLEHNREIPDTVIPLKVDEEQQQQWKATNKECGACGQRMHVLYLSKYHNPIASYNSIFKLGNKGLASGLKDKARSTHHTRRAKRVQAE